MRGLNYRRKRRLQYGMGAKGESGFVGFVKKRAGLLCFILVMLVVVAASAIVGLNPEFRAHFTTENTEPLYLDNNTVFEMTYTNQENAVIKTMGNSIIVCGKEKVFSLSDAGKVQWEIEVVLNEPILSICGEYIVVADRGGRDVYLINKGKVLLKTSSDYKIINAVASSDGKFIIISEEPYFKGLVSVRDAENNEVFVWHSGTGYIIDAVIGNDTNKLALAVLNTQSQNDEDAGGIYSSIILFNIYETEPSMTHNLGNCLVTNVYKADKNFMAVTDKNVVTVSPTGEIKGEFSYMEKSLNRIYKSSDMLTLLLENESGKKSISVLDLNAKPLCNIEAKNAVNFISGKSGRVVYGSGSDIIVCDTSGKELYVIQTTKKFNTFALMDSAKKAAGVTGTAIDIIEIK